MSEEAIIGKKKMGRPLDYCEKLADYICDTISTTHLSDAHLCKHNKKFPCRETLHAWRQKYVYFSDKYTRAKRTQVEVILDDVQYQFQLEGQDMIEHKDRLYFNNARVGNLRAYAGYNQWRAAKLLKATYGDSKEDNQNIQVNIDADAMLKRIENEQAKKK